MNKEHPPGADKAQETVTEFFRTPLYLEKLMQLLFTSRFARLDEYRVITGKLVNNLVECVETRPDIARRFLRDARKEYYLPYHSINVAVFAVSAAVCLNLDALEKVEVCLGALLHDAGMSHLPVEFFEKSGPLTSEEIFLIQQHPVEGHEQLKNENPHVRKIILSHHEKYRGGGYPRGTSFRFSGDNLAVIVGMADVYDAMTSFRSYREARTPDEARRELLLEAGTQWPKELVEAFIRGLNRLGL